MREALIILFVVGLLIVLTAIKYRRQIVGLLGFYKTFKVMRESIRDNPTRPVIRDRQEGIELVKCSRCGKWISPSTAANDSGSLVCINETCSTAAS